jgi:hypothetical protein
VESGFNACRALTPPGDDYFTPLFLLSNGFERLLKASICYALLEKYGDYPKAGTWKPGWWKTHSPCRLLSDLLELAQVPGVRAQAVLSHADDEASILGRMWRVIDEQSVAEAGRCHSLDVVLSRRELVHKGRLDPAFEWQTIENGIASRLIEDKTVSPDAEGIDEAYRLVATTMADEVGWLAWGIALMFKKWSLGQEARLFSDVVEPLLKHKPPTRIVFTPASEPPG